MRSAGDIDDEKKIIRVNKKKSKSRGAGEVLDTIVHEENHRLHPKMHEKTIREKTKEDIKKMSSSTKQRYHSLYKNKKTIKKRYV